MLLKREESRHGGKEKISCILGVLCRIVSTYRNETGNAEKENENWKRGLQEMSPLQIAQSAFEKIYQVEMPEELTDLFQEAYLAATRKEEEE